MNCPKCDEIEMQSRMKVERSSPLADGQQRTYRCGLCGHRRLTIERPLSNDLPPVVEKLTTGIKRLLRECGY